MASSQIQQTSSLPASFLTRGITPLSQPAASSGCPTAQVGGTCTVSSCFVMPPVETCLPESGAQLLGQRDPKKVSTTVDTLKEKDERNAETSLLCTDKEQEKKA